MAYLLIQQGEGEGRRFDLPDSGEIVFGRLASSTVELDDPSVSSRHCALSRDNGRYRIKDLDSTNGTRVNGDLVAESAVHRGDVITLGDLEMVLLGDDVPEPPRSVAIPEHVAAKTAPAAAPAVSGPVASTRPQFAPMTTSSASSANLPKAFQKKPHHNRLWAVVIFLACALAVFLAVQLFRKMS